MSLVAEIATLAHGYSMGDIERMAKSAAYIKSHSALDYSDAYEAAWHAIVEHLYSGEDRMSREDLIRLGTWAINDVVNATLSNHGITRGTYEEAPNFGKYWVSSARTVDTDFTDRIVERLALPQVLACLDDVEYEAISTLAAYGGVIASANALGIDRNTMAKRLKRARDKVLLAWLAPDHPPVRNVRRGDPDHCIRGHARSEHGFISGGKWFCRPCKRRNERHARMARKEATTCP